MLGAGCWVRGVGCRVRSAGCRVLSAAGRNVECNPRLLRQNPIAGEFYNLRSAALRDMERRGLGKRNVVVVDVEPARESEASVEDERADKRSGAVAVGLEHSGQSVDRRVEPRQRICVHARTPGCQPGQYRGVRREGHRDVRVGTFVPNTVCGQLIERWRQTAASAESAHAIAA